MKTILYTSLILIALGACRSAKKTKTTTATSSTIQAVHSNQQSLHEWQSSDSTYRYWYYGADSNFYFHPNGGLFGNKGVLGVQEFVHIQHLGRQSSDSISMQVQESRMANVKVSMEERQGRWVRYGVLIAVGIGLIFFFFEKI